MDGPTSPYWYGLGSLSEAKSKDMAGSRTSREGWKSTGPSASFSKISSHERPRFRL